ncbi:hypothetical protein QJS10_CPA09g00150 [Acorus calamus]|uniref:GPI mannosyltransferase 2 n=1 Tax=Acorus calamus TaxID=4465 RepID=A0AAV9E899_ACOCL|nr:hypothetical protein QJS10_CPA09g00150 [Acorus calamus]
MSGRSKPDTSTTRRVVVHAAASRLLLLTLTVLWRSLSNPYDTSASINPPCLSPSNQSSHARDPWFPRIGSAIERGIVWDSVYFVRIAQCGYEYEQAFAFLPLFPASLFLLSKSVFASLVPAIGFRATLALSGYVLNNVAFVLAAVYFYRVSVLILDDSAAALRASVLFCFNPASIFYSSLYSESLYALFTFGGLYYMISGADFVAILMFALSGSARSNGVLNAGYFCFRAMHRAFRRKQFGFAVKATIIVAVQALCIAAPFGVFQYYGYYNFCRHNSSGKLRPWCKFRIPILYDYIQSHYWGVGFLRYFQLKQLPNFVLASPILSLAVCSIVQYAKLRPGIFFSLGFRALNEEKDIAAVFYSLGTEHRSQHVRLPQETHISEVLEGNHMLRHRKHNKKEVDSDTNQGPKPLDEEVHLTGKHGFYSILVLPFILHMGFMAAVAFFIMHVQVATRFLSASPPIYWFISYLMTSTDSTSRKWAYLIWVYFAAYVLIGSLLFSNFYPFT